MKYIKMVSIKQHSANSLHYYKIDKDNVIIIRNDSIKAIGIGLTEEFTFNRKFSNDIKTSISKQEFETNYKEVIKFLTNKGIRWTTI